MLGAPLSVRVGTRGDLPSRGTGNRKVKESLEKVAAFCLLAPEDQTPEDQEWSVAAISKLRMTSSPSLPSPLKGQ